MIRRNSMRSQSLWMKWTNSWRYLECCYLPLFLIRFCLQEGSALGKLNCRHLVLTQSMGDIWPAIKVGTRHNEKFFNMLIALSLDESNLM